MKTLLSAETSLTKLDLVRTKAQIRRDAIKDRLEKQKQNAIAAQNKKTVVIQAIWRDRIWYYSEMYGGTVSLSAATLTGITNVVNQANDDCNLTYHDLQFFIRYMK